VVSAFSGFADWWQKTPFRPRSGITNGLLTGDFSYTFKKNGLRLGIVGLNSSFLQLTGKTDYKGRLVLDTCQFHGACESKDGVKWANRHDACILMTHHPFVWLNKDCADIFRRETMKSFCLHLCGHEHQTKVQQKFRALNNRACLNWIGRSLFGLEKTADGQKLEREHGYVSGKLSKVGKNVRFQFMPLKYHVQGDACEMVPDHDVELQNNGWTKAQFFSSLRPEPSMSENKKKRVGKPAKKTTTSRLPQITDYLQQLPNDKTTKSLHRQIVNGLKQQLKGKKVSDLTALVQQIGIQETLAAMVRWLLATSKKEWTMDADALRKVIWYLTVYGVVDDAWLTYAEKQNRGRFDVQADMNPLVGAVLVASLFDFVRRFEEYDPNSPEHYISMSKNVADTSYAPKDRLASLKKHLRETWVTDDNGVVEIFEAALDEHRPWFTILESDDALADAIEKEGLSGLLFVLQKRKKPPAVVEKITKLKTHLMSLFKEIDRLDSPTKGKVRA
jgi:hypothetical protein